MPIEKNVIGGFIVLDFVIFTAGFLAGILVVALVSVKMNFATVFIIFPLGFILDLLTVAMLLIMLLFTKLEKQSEEPGQA